MTGRDSATERLVVQHFNSITIENDLKAALVNPSPGVYDFAAGDAFVAFGERHKMFIVGHTLVWHNQTPPWFFQDSTGKPNTPSAQAERMRRYAELFEIFYRKRDKIDRVTLWGVHDGMSWKNGYPVPGRTNYPLLFGRDRKPKPAFDAVVTVPRSTATKRPTTRPG